MRSPVHKFFVTKKTNKDFNDFSSIQHLNAITKANSGSIYKDDIIELLNSNNLTLIKTASMFVETNHLPQPIVTDDSYISLLRTLIKRFNKSGKLFLNKPKEIFQIQNLIKELSHYNSNYIHVNEIVENILFTLSQISNEEFVNHENKVDSIVIFDELNRLLTRYQEMIDENLEFSNLNLLLDEKGAFKVVANVYSYNIVDYLNAIFKYYGYKISSGVLDSNDFGVPQRRKRFIMIGIKKEVTNFSLPSKPSSLAFTVKDAIKDLEDIEPQT